jgi:hypothetical protein
VQRSQRTARIKRLIKKQEKKISSSFHTSEIPDPPPLTNDTQFNNAMDSIRHLNLSKCLIKLIIVPFAMNVE